MTAPAPARSREQRIADLFLGGYSLDLVAERGMSAGWTRADARRVVEQRGWELDASGRIPREHRTQGQPPAEPMPPPVRPLSSLAQPPQRPTPPPPPWLVALNTGRTHPVARVRKLADRIAADLDKLAGLIEESEEERRARQRLAELDVERERLRALLRKKPAPKPRPSPAPAAPRGLPSIEHGTWSGFLTEKRRGLEHCDGCVAAKDKTMADRAALRAQRKTA